MSDEEPLDGGGTTPGVVRVGDTVRRPAGARSGLVRAVLRRLEEAGVPAPRFLGSDDAGREVLSYLPGRTGHGRHDWSDDGLAAAARWCRRMHDALAGTGPAGDAETVRHGDLAPWNVVLDVDGTPAAFFDFDAVAPGRRVDDLGYLAWTFCGLGDPVSDPHEQGLRLRTLADAYADGGGPALHDGLLAAVARQQATVRRWRAAQVRTHDDPAVRALAARRVAQIEVQERWLADRHGTLATALHRQRPS